MGDAIKWALLTAFIIATLAVAIPMISGVAIGVEAIPTSISVLLQYCASFLKSARGLLNNFVLIPGLLSAFIMWRFTKWAATTAIRVTTQIYTFIFRG